MRYWFAFDVSYIDGNFFNFILFSISSVIEEGSMSVKVLVLFGIKLVKTFKRVSLSKVTWACISLPLKAFFQLKDSAVEFTASTLALF